MFDPSKPAHILQLSTELNTDPALVGYDLAGSSRFNLKRLNNGALNTGGETTRKTLTVARLYKAIDLTELDGLTAPMERLILSMLNKSVEEDISALENTVKTVFGASSVTYVAITNQMRTLSRAEVLFGEGSYVNKQAFVKARDL